MRKGDIIVGIQDTDIGTGKRATEKVIDTIGESPNGILLRVLRGVDSVQIFVEPALICNLPVELREQKTVNASTDGERIYVTKGMMNFLHSNNDLAFVIGHEFAHVVRGHIETKHGNALSGALIGAIITGLSGVPNDQNNQLPQYLAEIGSGLFSQEFEAEADYTGLYYTARAGFDIQHVPEVWRRMAEAHPDGIHLAGSTHPSSAKRYLAIQEAVREIDRKRANGLPLVPDERR